MSGTRTSPNSARRALVNDAMRRCRRGPTPILVLGSRSAAQRLRLILAGVAHFEPQTPRGWLAGKGCVPEFLQNEPDAYSIRIGRHLTDSKES